MALGKVDLGRLNDKKRSEKRNQNDVENRGFFSGVIARGLRGNAIDKAYDKSEAMIEQYGGDAAKSRGFMAYDKPPTSKTEQKTSTPPSVIESRKKIAAKGDVTRRNEGGVVKMKEGSAKDMREDKAMAKKSGMTMKQHEASAADKKHDAPKKMAKGGVVKKAMGGTADPAVVARMTQGLPPAGTGAPRGSGSRFVAFEGPNDGMPGMRPPKPNMGPMPPRRPMGTPIAASTSSTPSTPTAVDPRGMKKGGGVEKKAKGGMVRGAGCAVRGKTGAKEY